MMKKFVLGGMVVVAALLGNACGNDGSSDSPAGPADSEATLSPSSDDVALGSSSSSSVIESSLISSGQTPQSAMSDRFSSSEGATGSSSSSGGKNSSSSGKVESNNSDEGENSSSSKKVLSSSSAKTEGASSSVKTEESSSSEILDKSSSSDKPVESSSSETKPAESSSSEMSSSSMRPEESSPSEESSSSMKQSSSSVVISSSSVESVAEIKPNGYYKSNCPEGKKCNYVSTDYLNQEFLLDNKYGEILDSRDNKVYKTIEIEDQVWIAQNLNYASGKSSCYEYKTENCSRYGRLYTWAGAIDSLKIYREYGARCGYNQTGCGFLGEKWRGVCPLGWHLPTKAEFEKLLTNAHAWSRSAILKSNNSWHNDKGDDLFGIDSVGFSAVPGGFRFYNSEYDQLGLQAYFWSFTEFDYPNNAKAAYELFMTAVNEVVGLTSSISKGEALSVRCIKD